MYLVWCMTNYGNGYYLGGIYNSYNKAKKRLAWCTKHTIDPENDSWRISVVRNMNIREDFE